MARPNDDRAKAVADELSKVAGRAGVSVTAAAYGWIMAHPSRPIPIVGSQQRERITEAAQALTFNYTRPEWYAVLTAARGTPLP